MATTKRCPEALFIFAMVSALQLVDRLLEAEDIDWAPDPEDPDAPASDAVDAVSKRLDTLNQREWRLAFYIDTNDEHSIRANAQERGIAVDEGHGPFWQQINADVRQIERNAQKIFVAHGLVFREEDHTDYGLGGSIWLRYEDHKNFTLVKEHLDRGEPWSTTSGTLGSLKHGDRIYDGVSDIGQQVIDVSIDIRADDDDKQEILDL